ncbi:MAG: ABC transporter permease [Betaproteobacteria bacterium]|nr:ABC transporter permease [Betaproteobacteria bacterium]
MAYLAIVLRRVVQAIGLLAAVAILNFTLIHLAPGDIVSTIVGEMGGASEETIAELRRAYGVDRSYLEQLGIYLARVAGGDLGTSIYYNKPVFLLILDRVPATVLLLLAALTLALVAGTALGVLAARYPRGWFAAAVNLVSLFGFSAPVFWSGLMLLLLFASAIPILPPGGFYDVVAGAQGLAKALDIAHHLVLPATTLALIFLALYSRLARASMIEVLGSDYVRTARAKGLPERTVIFKHALRNALLPVVTVAGLQFSAMLAGAVLVETVFTWPGLGQLAFESILRRDNQLILGILLLSAVLVTFGNLITDVLYRIVDPRIKTDG